MNRESATLNRTASKWKTKGGERYPAKQTVRTISESNRIKTKRAENRTKLIFPKILWLYFFFPFFCRVFDALCLCLSLAVCLSLCHCVCFPPPPPTPLSLSRSLSPARLLPREQPRKPFLKSEILEHTDTSIFARMNTLPDTHFRTLRNGHVVEK